MERKGLGLALLLGVCATFWAASACATETLRLQLYWVHQAQFAGYYLAEARGYYQQEGLAVELLPSGPGLDPLQRLDHGEVDVAIGWLSHAIETRRKGHDLVNIAQIFQKSGMALVCRKSSGVYSFADLPGRSIGIWGLGDDVNLHWWLSRSGISPASVQLVPQGVDGRDLIDGRLPCVTVMVYNEYWRVLEAGIRTADLYTVRFGDEGLGVLEDGLYVSAARLAGAAFRNRLARFLRATARGWQNARDYPDEALAATLAKAPELQAGHQRRMLETVLQLLQSSRPFGLLDLRTYEQNIAILAQEGTVAATIRQVARRAWTHHIWYAASLSHHETLTVATRHYLSTAVGSGWFYLLDLVGTVAFGLAGFMRAQQRRYNLWGAFVLTALPAVGGGTLRDLLVGGERHPPFIFKDPIYLYVVFAVVLGATLLTRRVPVATTQTPRFEHWLSVFDAIGLAAFTVVGVKVALLAELSWYWVPICSALTCVGGGMLLDVVTGREPRTFLGEPYEEIAATGGLLLYGGLRFSDRYEHAPWLVTALILLTMVLIFSLRLLIIAKGMRSYRLGEAEAGS
jgi:NitT/TauT family transport system substrate-binding protein